MTVCLIFYPPGKKLDKLELISCSKKAKHKIICLYYLTHLSQGALQGIVTKTPHDYIRVHTSNTRVHTGNIRVHTSNIRVTHEYIRVTYE